MKKLITLTLITILLASITFAFPDTNSHWGNTYVQKLVALKAINGYPDGTFKPDNTITIGAFTKILVTSLGHTNIQNATTGHWATTYMTKAKALNLVLASESEFYNLDQNITRGQMARMISRAMTETFSDMNKYKDQIKDYTSIKSTDQTPVLLMYRSGIITGYPDGTFKDTNSATRAEASTMLVRFLYKEERKEPVLVDNGYPKIEEPTGEDRIAFSILLNINDDFESQLSVLKEYLETKQVDEQTINEIIAYVKLKNRMDYHLDVKSFKWLNSKINVSSGYGWATISIAGI